MTMPGFRAMAAGTGSHARVDVIDGLRALAVLGVIAYHFQFAMVPGGYVGVDVFFVISGYVISKSLAQRPFPSIGMYLAEFYKRRILRLLPALACCLLAVSLLAMLFVPNSWLSENNTRTAALAFVGLGNFGVLQEMDGYFAARTAFNPFVHTWSLGVEEQFYVLFPLLFWVWLQAGNTSHDGGTRAFARWALPTLAVGSLIYSAFETAHSPERAFYLLPSRFWELAAGAMLFQAHSRGRLLSQSVAWSSVVAVAGFLLLGAGFIWTQSTAFPFPFALIPVCGTLAMIAVGMSGNGSRVAAIGVLRWAPVVYVGRISYSLYLWHWPVVCLLRWTTGFSGAVTVTLALLLTLVLGVASYHLVERPFQRLPLLVRFHSVPTIVVSVCLAMLLGFGVSSSYRRGYALRMSVVEHAPGWEAHDLPATHSPPERALHVGATKLFVIGDSHSWAYSGMVDHASARLRLKSEIMSTSGCAMASLLEPYPDTAYCRNFFAGVLEHLQHEARPGDVVFLASLRSYRMADQWGELAVAKDQDIERARNRTAALLQTRYLLQRLHALGLTIVIDAPKPVFRAPPFRCSDWFNRMNPVCAPGFSVTADELQSRNEPVLIALQNLKKEFPDLVVWDPFPILCPGKTCSAFRDGKPLFFDGDHLSGNGNALLLPSFVAMLAPLTK